MNWGYDAEADILYVCVGKTGSAVGVDLGGGIIARYDGVHEEVVGITLIGLRARLLSELKPNNRTEDDDKRERLVRILRQQLTREMRSQLEELKDRARRDIERPEKVRLFFR